MNLRKLEGIQIKTITLLIIELLFFPSCLLLPILSRSNLFSPSSRNENAFHDVKTGLILQRFDDWELIERDLQVARRLRQTSLPAQPTQVVENETVKWFLIQLEDFLSNEDTDSVRLFRQMLQNARNAMENNTLTYQQFSALVYYWLIHPELVPAQTVKAYVLGYPIAYPGLETAFRDASMALVSAVSYISDGRYAGIAGRTPTISKDEALEQMQALAAFLTGEGFIGDSLTRRWFTDRTTVAQQMKEVRRLQELPLIDHVIDPFPNDETKWSPANVHAVLAIRLLVYIQVALKEDIIDVQALAAAVAKVGLLLPPK